MPPSKSKTKLKQSIGHAMISPVRISNAPSGNVRDDQESNVTQILSQRLNNMEQQLMLLRSDLKDAIDTLKRKDQEITTLENKIALVERKKDAEKNGSPNEILSDLSEDVDPETKSKQQLLQKECDGIAQKLQEMEKFFGDYGLVWVKEDALDETDPNNLWVRKTDIHYTPDFDKIFLVVEELNVGNAEPQIVKKGNTAQFKRADLLNLTLYADGIQLENNPFRLYDSPSVEEFFRDLEDGYFPTELKGEYPEGVIFKVKDMRNTMFADDPHRRTARPVTSPRSVSPSSVPRGSTKLPPKDDGKNEFEKDSKLDACKSLRRSRTLSRKFSASSRRSIIKSTAAKSRETSLVADGKLLPQDGGTKPETSGVGGDPKASPRGGSLSGPQIRPSKVGVNDNNVNPGKDGEVPKTVSGEEGEGTKRGVAPGADVIKTKDDAADGAASSPGTKGGVAAGADVVKTKDDAADGAASSPGTKGGVAEVADFIKTKDNAADGAASSPGTGVGNGFRTNDHKKSDPQTSHTSMKQLFVGRSPQVSTTRVSQPRAKDIQKIVLDKELTNDSFGLPRPPLSPSVSDRIKDPPKPTRPPSQHFDNYFLNKAEETQTSGTYVMPQTPQPQPTHITNITYNEAPITIQMTPSELKGTENKTTPTPLNVCPSHHPHPCNCAHGPPKSTTQEEDSAIGLIRIPGETEYREKFTESAANATNVLQKKKKTHEESAKIPSPQDVAPIPPDPLAMGAAFDPNVQWPNFRYLGHPKGQETIPPPPTPVTQPHSPKKEPDSRQVIQLNEKTSDRMISVNMRTKSGSKEYVAHLYPDEPAKELISLLKMNEGDSLIVDNEEKAVTVHTNVAEISSESGPRVVVPRFEDQKPKKFYPERPNLGRTNPDLFKNYPGEIEVKKKKRRKKTDEKKASIESVSSDSISMKTEKSEDDNESRDLAISRYKNRDWLSKEVYSRINVPRVTSRELKIMLDTIKREDISITTVQDTTAKQIARSESDLPPKIVSEDVVSVERIKAHKSNYSTRKREVLETGKNCEILPGGEKSRSSSLISESQCTKNSFAAGPRKKAGRRNIHESTSSLNIVGMDQTFSERRKIRVFAEPSGSGEREKHRSSRVSPDTSIFSEPDKRESHSLIFKRSDSEESSEVAEKESLHGGLKIEFLDNTSRNSEISFCYSWACRSRSDVNIADHSIPPKTREGGIHHEDPNSRFGDEDMSSSIEDALSDRELLDDRGPVARRASSSGIRSDGFEAATLLEIVGAMLKAQKEYKMEKLRDMKRDGVLVRENSSDVSISTEFIPPPDVVKELEELKRSLGSVSPVSPPPCYSEESNREFAERLLEELLSRKSSPEEIIRKLEARKNGSSILPEAPPKHADRKRRGRVNKKPTKPRERHKEFNAYLYPEEPVKKLWSLLKLNDKEYSLTATQAPHTPLRRGSIGDHVRDNNLTLVLSKTKLNAGEKRGSKSSMNAQPTKVKSETSSTEGVTKMSKKPKQELSTSSKDGPTLSPSSTTKAKTELTTASKDGSNVTNVNMNINIDSQKTDNERAQATDVEQTKQEPINIEESILPKRRKSSSHSEVKKKSGGSDHSVSSLVHPRKKPKDPESQREIPISPKNRAQALSERLSQVSLSRKSFQSVSHRNSIGQGSVHLKPASLDEEGQSSSKEDGKTRGSKEFAKNSPHSSISHVGDKVSSPKNLLDNLESRAPTSKEHINSATNNEPKTIQSSQSLKNLNNKTSSKRSLVENFGPTSPIRRKAKKRTSKPLIVEEGEKLETQGSKEFAKTSPHSSISHVGDKVSSPKNLLDNLESRAPTSKEHINSATNNEPKTIQSSQSLKNLNNKTSSKRSLVENFGPTSPIRRKAKKRTSKSLIVEEGEKPETQLSESPASSQALKAPTDPKIVIPPASLDEEGRGKSSSKENGKTRGSKEFAKTSPHSSISHVGDKVSSPKNLLDNLESRVPTSKEHINSATNNEPKTIQSSQSLKNLNNKTSSKRSLVENFGPTSPIRRKAKKRTSKSLIVEEGEKPETQLSESTASSQALKAPTDPKIVIPPASLDEEGRGKSSSKENGKTRGSKEFAKTSPHSSISHVGDKVSSPKNLLDNLESRVPTSKEHINSATNNEPKTIQSSQSLKNLNNKTSSKRSLVENFGPTSPIRRKAKKRTSKSLIVEEGEKPETQLSESTASSQALKAPTNPKIVIHRTSNPSLEQEKLADQIILGKDFNSERKSTGLKNSKENLSSVEEIKVDQKTSGTRSERRVSSNKGISTGKHDNFITPGQDTSHTDKLMASEKDQTRNKMETDAQRRSPEHEIVTPIITEMVHSFHQDASKGGSAVDDPSKKPDGSRNGSNMPEQIHKLADTIDRKKSMSPPKSGITVNGDDITKPPRVHPITNVGGATVQLKEGGDSSKPRDGNPIISAEGATISLKEGGDSFKIRDFDPIISVGGTSISLKESEEIATPNVHAPNAEHSSKLRDGIPINSAEGATISLKENEQVATPNVKAPNAEHISKPSDANPIISAEGATISLKENEQVATSNVKAPNAEHISKPSDANTIISAEGATISLKEHEQVATSNVKAPNAEHISKPSDVNPIISAEGATISLKEGGGSSKPSDVNPIISAEGAAISLKENEQVATPNVKAPNAEHISKLSDAYPIINAEGATISLKEGGGSSKPSDVNPIISAEGATISLKEGGDSSKVRDANPIISAEGATISLKENEQVATSNVKAPNAEHISKPSDVNPIISAEGATISLKEVGDSPKVRDANQIISAEGATISLKENEQVATSNVKAPNAEHISKPSDVNPIISAEGATISLKEVGDSSKVRDANQIISAEGATVSLKENEQVATSNVKAPNAEHISKPSDVNPIISAEGATISLKEGGGSSKPSDVNPIISAEGATISLKEVGDSSKVRDANPIISAEGATISLKENEQVATSNVKAPNAEHISKPSDVNPIISAEGATISLKEVGDSSKVRDANQIISAEGATVSLKENEQVATSNVKAPNAEHISKPSDVNPIISAEGATISLKEGGGSSKPSDVNPIISAEGATISLKEVGDSSKVRDANPIISAEGATVSQKENEEVATPKVKAPNEEPPRIEQSDAEFADDKEAKVSSVNHSPNREYDKHDSEQEFKRETPTGSPTITTAKEDKEQPEENTDKNVEEKIVKPKNGTRKSGNKKKPRKSSKEENDGMEKQDDSQERKKSDGNGEKNEDLASPVISEEDNVASDNTKVQNADDVSERSLT